MKEDSAALRLLEAMNRARRILPQPHSICGVRRSEMSFLFFLYRHRGEYPEGLKASELGAQLGVAAPSVTQTVNQLERRGYVCRMQDKADRRIIRVRLTDEGGALMQRHEQEFTGYVTELAAYLGEQDTAELLRLMARIREFGEQKRKTFENRKGGALH